MNEVQFPLSVYFCEFICSDADLCTHYSCSSLFQKNVKTLVSCWTTELAFRPRGQRLSLLILLLNSSFSNLSGPSDHGGTAGFKEDFETKPWMWFQIVLYVLVVSLILACSVL